MRFAYIDSQGNEVSIPSVDALALRIELGAIGPDTELYDEAAGRWGPAHTHEIFLTLSRDRDMEEDGFVAPPPPAAESTAGEQATAARAVGPAGEETRYELSAHLEMENEDDEVEEGEDRGKTTPSAFPSTDDLGMDLTLIQPGESAPPPTDSSTEEPGTPTPDEPPASGHDIPLDEADEAVMDFSSPIMDMGGGLELEQPMSEFSPESPPAWMEQDGPEQEPMMDLSRPPDRDDGDEAHTPLGSSGGAAAGAPGRSRARPEPRDRPSPPRRRRRLPVRPILYFLLLGGVGVGGWYAWSAFQARRQAQRASERAAVRPPVVIPAIPSHLRSQMQSLASAALDGMVAAMDSERAAFHLPAEPRRDWLAGVYLANASRYPDIERYWVAIDSFVDHVRATDAQVFHREFVAGLAEAGIKGDTAGILLARADSGFLATRNARIQAYDQMEDLVNAALDLHQFLLDNEQQIAYEPAAGGVSRDPVLEAVPDNKALGDRMWGMVDRITGALDALGSLDKVSSERLLSVLFKRIHEAGFK